MTGFDYKVVDCSHYEVVADDGWERAKTAGIIGMIAKCTQGTRYVDPKYHEFVEDAAEAGLLTGSYHFNNGDDPIEQAKWYLKNNGDYKNHIYCLDFENNPKSDMSIDDAVKFLHHIEDNIGKKAIIYSGNKLKEMIGDLSDEDKAYVCSHKLWLAQYSTKYKLPEGFSKFFLWQATGDGHGPEPHWVDGIKCPGNGGLDLNVYDGKDEDLIAEWAT